MGAFAGTRTLARMRRDFARTVRALASMGSDTGIVVITIAVATTTVLQVGTVRVRVHEGKRSC